MADRTLRDQELADQIDAVLLASRVLVALSAQSIAAVEDVVSLTQLRVLVIVAARGPLDLTALAEVMGVHSSSATRACDRLVGHDLLDRRHNPGDRRQVMLSLTPKGRRLVESIIRRRRAAIEQIVRQMPTAQRRALAPAMRNFARAGGERGPGAVVEFGWPDPA